MKDNPTFYNMAAEIGKYNGRKPTYGKHTDISFQDFLAFVTDPEGRNINLNEHWATYHYQCHPCQFKYDYIAQIETMAEDSR